MEFLMVTGATRHLFPAALDAFFQARHLVYAEELGWVPQSINRRERDQFDSDSADYLIVLDQGECIAGSRLLPTHVPHLLSEVFPQSCNRVAMPRDPLVAEWTRGFVVPHRREKGRPVLLAQCCAAVMEHCLARGYRQVGGIQDAKWLPLWKLMGWQVTLHGDAVLIDGAPWLPAYFEVTEKAMMAARKFGKLDGPALAPSPAQAAA